MHPLNLLRTHIRYMRMQRLILPESKTKGTCPGAQPTVHRKQASWNLWQISARLRKIRSKERRKHYMFLQPAFLDQRANRFNQLITRRVVICQLDVDKSTLSNGLKNFLQCRNFLPMEFLREKATGIQCAQFSQRQIFDVLMTPSCPIHCRIVNHDDMSIRRQFHIQLNGIGILCQCQFKRSQGVLWRMSRGTAMSENDRLR